MTLDAPSVTPAKRSYLLFLVGVVISGLALILLFLVVDTEALVNHLKNARVEYIVLGVGIVYPIAIFFRAKRWEWLLHHDLDYWQSFHVLNVGYLANMIFPARLGEVVRLFLVRNTERGSMSKAISAIAVERLLDLLFALFSIGLGLALIGENTSLPPEVITTLTVFITVTLVGFIFLFLLPPVHPHLIRLVQTIGEKISPGLTKRIVPLLTHLLESMRQLAHPRYFAIITGWTLITWAGYTLFFYLILWAFTPDPTIGAALLANGFIALSIGVPSAPSFAGPFHVGATLALTSYGYDESLGASFALVSHALITLLTISVGAISMNKLNLNVSRLRRLR